MRVWNIKKQAYEEMPDNVPSKNEIRDARIYGAKAGLVPGALGGAAFGTLAAGLSGAKGGRTYAKAGAGGAVLGALINATARGVQGGQILKSAMKQSIPIRRLEGEINKYIKPDEAPEYRQYMDEQVRRTKSLMHPVKHGWQGAGIGAGAGAGLGALAGGLSAARYYMSSPLQTHRQSLSGQGKAGAGIGAIGGGVIGALMGAAVAAQSREMDRDKVVGGAARKYIINNPEYEQEYRNYKERDMDRYREDSRHEDTVNMYMDRTGRWEPKLASYRVTNPSLYMIKEAFPWAAIGSALKTPIARRVMTGAAIGGTGNVIFGKKSQGGAAKRFLTGAAAGGVQGGQILKSAMKQSIPIRRLEGEINKYIKPDEAPEYRQYMDEQVRRTKSLMHPVKHGWQGAGIGAGAGAGLGALAGGLSAASGQGKAGAGIGAIGGGVIGALMGAAVAAQSREMDRDKVVGGAARKYIIRRIFNILLNNPEYEQEYRNYNPEYEQAYRNYKERDMDRYREDSRHEDTVNMYMDRTGRWEPKLASYRVTNPSLYMIKEAFPWAAIGSALKTPIARRVMTGAAIGGTGNVIFGKKSQGGAAKRFLTGAAAGGVGGGAYHGATRLGMPSVTSTMNKISPKIMGGIGRFKAKVPGMVMDKVPDWIKDFRKNQPKNPNTARQNSGPQFG